MNSYVRDLESSAMQDGGAYETGLRTEARESPAFSILTWGCQMNEDDSDQMASLLMRAGYMPAKNVEDADIILLNTCSVRAKPEQKVRSKLGELRKLKERKPDLIIGVCGCMAQKEGEALRSHASHIDLIVGTANIDQIPELINRVRERRERVEALDLPRTPKDEARPPSRTRRERAGLKAFVPVMYGCDNFCSYCVVPYVRGKERSRPPEEIIREVCDLVERGCREITLLGQNVNSYGRTLEKPITFARLLEMLDGLGVERIRFTTSHPKDLSDELIDAIGDLPHVCEHIHLPIQSGDDEILRRMKRGYDVERYAERLSALRRRVPGIGVTTDIIVGFPGETEKQFENTIEVVKRLQFDSAYMFAFNAIPGTGAAALEGQIDAAEKNRRLQKLIATQNAISVQRNQAEVGMEFEVLVEGRSPKDQSKLTGLTRHKKTVNFPCEQDLSGHLIKVRATRGHLWGLSGELISVCDGKLPLASRGAA